MKRTARWTALLAALPLLAGCAWSSADAQPEPSVSAGPVPVGLERYYDQTIDWELCGAQTDCATFAVPRDYADPDAAGDFTLHVLRYRSTGDANLGSLVVNPGGPGGSGVDYARSAASVVSPSVLDAYNIVGLDPRGVGASDPVDCVSDAQIDELLATDMTPDDQAEVDQLVARSGEVGQGCQAKSADRYRWLDTVSTARDLDVLRHLLGEPALDYLGASYGTMLGATYAQLFPDNVGRFVLDGALPTDLTSQELSRDQAVGFDTALRRFVAACLDGQKCPLSGSVDEGVAQIQRLLDDLDAHPLPAEPGRPLNQALGVTAVLYYLYFPPTDWVQLRDGLIAALNGDGSVLLQMLDARTQRDSSGEFADNQQEAFYAVSCLDRESASIQEIEQLAGSWAADAPTFGPYLAWSDAVCAQWPVPAVGGAASAAPALTPPLLVISTQYDPATPYQWGARLAAQFENAVLVSYNGDGHTAYGTPGSDCVDAVVDAYLMQGEVPGQDPRCGY